MIAETDETLTPDQIASDLAGDLGGEAQFQAMKLWLPQYIERAMTTARVTAGSGVALSEGLEQTMIYEP